MSSSSNKKNWSVIIFAAGCCVFVTLVGSAVLIAHGFKALANISILLGIVSMAGFLFPDWVAYYSSFYCTHEKRDLKVIFTSYAVMVVITLTILISSGVVIAHYMLNKAATDAAVAADTANKSQAEIDKDKEKTAAQIAIEKDRQFDNSIASLKQSGVSERIIRQRIKDHEAAKAREATQKATETSLLLASTAATPTPKPKDEVDVPASIAWGIHQFSTIYVFILVPLVAFIGFAILLFMLILPGGASLSATSDGETLFGSNETIAAPVQSEPLATLVVEAGEVETKK